MLNGRRIVCVLPAYNAQKTLERTLGDVPAGVVDRYILVDDGSTDETVATARRLAGCYPLLVVPHDRNRGYGGNQKTCYDLALREGADVVVMLHPDYQYDPRLMGAIAGLVASGVYDVVLGSRILGNGALKGGMPLYKYIGNRVLTAFENLLIGQRLSEYHTGYRAFSRQVLTNLRLSENSDDFVFDNEILVQVVMRGYSIGEVSVPTRYFPDASSISLGGSLRYGAGVLRCSVEGLLCRTGLFRHRRYS